MRSEHVDERDSAWERDDPRFRVFVFKGADKEVTATDITGGTVEDAMESARALSNDNEHLWSLAVVVDEVDGARGLIWLSGMDYNSAPSTARQWQLRRQMQNR